MESVPIALGTKVLEQGIAFLYKQAERFLELRQARKENKPAPPVPAGAEKAIPKDLASGLTDFALEIKEIEITGLLKTIKAYQQSLAFEEERLAQYGNPERAPAEVRNAILATKRALAEKTNELVRVLQEVFGPDYLAPRVFSG